MSAFMWHNKCNFDSLYQHGYLKTVESETDDKRKLPIPRPSFLFSFLYAGTCHFTW